MPIRDPSCPICSKPLKAGSLVLFQHGELFHIGCAGRATQARAMELGDRSAKAQACAAQTVERSTELVEAARRLHLGRCVVPPTALGARRTGRWCTSAVL
jgi:hypothetical protein